MATYKQYVLSQSPFFGISSRGVLAKLLGIGELDLVALEQSLLGQQEFHYAEFAVGPKKRHVQQPTTDSLVSIQKRIKRLFSRILPPSYLVSGRRGLSYIDNGRQHIGAEHLLKIDIRKFYESTRSHFIVDFLQHKMHMASDLAILMANICTFDDPKQHARKIPTGSTLSQIVAYWAYSEMFDAISILAREAQVHFTLYVDDMTFSSNEPISSNFHEKVQGILASRWLSLKPTKVKYLGPKSLKIVTGCDVSNSAGLRAPNEIWKKARIRLRVAFGSSATLSDVDRAIGLVHSLRQAEPHALEQSLVNLKAIRRRLAVG